jgi:hypothetical protein
MNRPVKPWNKSNARRKVVSPAAGCFCCLIERASPRTTKAVKTPNPIWAGLASSSGAISNLIAMPCPSWITVKTRTNASALVIIVFGMDWLVKIFSHAHDGLIVDVILPI